MFTSPPPLFFRPGGRHPLAHKLSRARKYKADVVIDLNGHAGLSSVDLLSMRIAPVQMHWHAYPGTIGSMNAIEHYVADKDSVQVFVFRSFFFFSPVYFEHQRHESVNARSISDQKTINLKKKKKNTVHIRRWQRKWLFWIGLTLPLIIANGMGEDWSRCMWKEKKKKGEKVMIY